MGAIFLSYIRPYELVHLLCEYGANQNLQNCWGNTPLHIALINKKDTYKKEEIISFLLQLNSVDFSLRNKKNKTVLDIAKRNGYHEEELLLSNMLSKIISHTILCVKNVMNC